MKTSAISTEAKVGIFAIVGILLIAYMSFRVSDRTVVHGGLYDVYVILNSASGMDRKTPVEIAGVQVGYIDEIELINDSDAKVKLKLRKNVKLAKDVVAQVRTKGFLGQSYIDIIPGHPEAGYLEPGETITAVNPFTDISEVATTFNELGQDARKVVKNLDTFSGRLTDFGEGNYNKWNEIVENLRILSEDLRVAVRESRADIEETSDRLASITRRIDEGQGSLGKLINDPETVDNVNNTLQGMNQAIGGINRYEIGIGYHFEYLGVSNDFKNYAEFTFKPRPDKFFLLEFIVDPDPAPIRTSSTTTVTTGATSTTVTTDRAVIHRDKLLFSAQLAKQFYDFTLRGGIIESEGGFGVDYGYGPMSVRFSAFDWNLDAGERPHLKAFATLNITPSLYILGGADDLISNLRDPDWMVGFGINLIDEDLKSLMGAVKLR